MADTHIREQVVRGQDNENSGISVGLVLGAILAFAIILFLIYYDDESDTDTTVTPTQQQQTPTPQDTDEEGTEQTQDEETQLFFEENTEEVIPTEVPSAAPEPTTQTMRNDHYQMVVML